jgi:hypothetical protein
MDFSLWLNDQTPVFRCLKSMTELLTNFECLNNKKMQYTNFSNFQRGMAITIRVSLFLLVVLSGLIFIPMELEAQGDLMITPRRIVFEGNKQREEITLANTGQDTARYTVSFVQYRMTTDGSFEQIEAPDEGQLFADPYLRFFPRSVSLPPGESQVVRMQLRKPGDLEAGEYRSHIYFRAVPEERALGDEDLTLDTGAIGIRLTPIFGITIPVIIRHGNLSSTVELKELSVVQELGERPRLYLTFMRTGNKSVFGDLIVTHRGANGEEREIGIVRGIAVYTPNSMRKFSMQLNVPVGVDLSSGKIDVKFIGPSDTDKTIYARASLEL